MSDALLRPVRLASFISLLSLLPWLIACGSSAGTNSASANNPGATNPGSSSGSGSTGSAGSGSGSSSGSGSGSAGTGSGTSSPGSGSGSSSTPGLTPPKFLYVVGRPAVGAPNGNSTTVSGFDVNAGTGALSRISDLGFTGIPNLLPMGAVSTPDGNILFLSGNEINQSTATYSLQAFAIDHANGSLSALPQGQVTSGVQFKVAVHPSNKFVYLGFQNFNSPSIGAYEIAENQGLSPVAGQPFATKTAGQLVPDPSGNFLYIVSDHTIDALRVDQQTGALSPLAGFPITVRASQSSPGRLPLTLTGVMDPLGDFLFALDTANAGAIWTYRIDKATGALLLTPNSPFNTNPLVGSAFSGQVDPTGHFLYAVDWYFDTIGGFSIDRTTGALTPIPGMPVQPPTWTPSGPTGGNLVIDPSGKFLYFNDGVTLSSSFQIVGYSIDQKSGALSSLPNPPTPTDFSGELIITH